MTSQQSVILRHGLYSGTSSEFTHFYHVKPGHAEALRGTLHGIGASEKRPTDLIPTVHELRFVLFDNDTRLLFATTFDGDWDTYIEDFARQVPQAFNAVFEHVEGFHGIEITAFKQFFAGSQEPAVSYTRSYNGTTQEIKRALRVEQAFQQVLDDPRAAQALQHPALKPLLEEAAD